MKKFAVALGVVAVLAGCTFGDAFIDRREAHNGLIHRLNAILAAEEAFYDEYYTLTDGLDITPFVQSYEDFKGIIADLDDYMAVTEFGSTQQFYLTDYNDTFKPFMDEYIAYAGEFVEVVKSEGFQYEIAQPYFEKLDQYTIDFSEVYNTYAVAVDENAGNY